MELKSHWEQVYTTKSAQAVTWYQPHATLSLDLICRLAQGKSMRILDVGGGASNLVDDLLAHGMTGVGVLDISRAALMWRAKGSVSRPGVSTGWKATLRPSSLKKPTLTSGMTGRFFIS